MRNEDAAELAKAAGLEKAWAEHREDVLEAIDIARRWKRGFLRPDDAAAEPMPSFIAPGTAPAREGK